LVILISYYLACNESSEVKAVNTTYDKLNYLRLSINILIHEGIIQENDMISRVISFYYILEQQKDCPSFICKFIL
jgi:hypothetical protein